jgi:hypothetical protein
MSRFSRSAWESAVIAIGVRWTSSERLRAVTMISSKPPPAAGAASGAAPASEALTGPPNTTATMLEASRQSIDALIIQLPSFCLRQFRICPPPGDQSVELTIHQLFVNHFPAHEPI